MCILTGMVVCSLNLSVLRVVSVYAASGGYSEEELEEKQQELRNMLDEQFGQNMMVMKESMSKQHEETQKTLKQELDSAKQQVGQLRMVTYSKSSGKLFWPCKRFFGHIATFFAMVLLLHCIVY